MGLFSIFVGNKDWVRIGSSPFYDVAVKVAKESTDGLNRHAKVVDDDGEIVWRSGVAEVKNNQNV
jgi:hypothetical protein